MLTLLASRPAGGLRLGDRGAGAGCSRRNHERSRDNAAAEAPGGKLCLSQDRRALSLTVTERGRRLAAGFNDWPDRMLDAVSGLPAGDQEGLLRALVHLIYQLQQRGMIPVSRMCITCRYFRPRVHPDPLRPHHCDFVDAPFGDRHLRLDCPEQQPATEKRASRAWKRWQ